jgi:hypothetical protein
VSLVISFGTVFPVASQQPAEVHPRVHDTVVFDEVPRYPTDLARMSYGLLIATIDGIVYRLPDAKPNLPILDIR